MGEQTKETGRIRVALVEFANLDGFQCGVGFPLLRGLLAHADVPTLWLRFALPRTARTSGSEAGVPLPPAEQTHLQSQLDAFAATHLIFSHAPTPSLLRALTEARAAALFGGEPADGAPLPELPNLEGAARWLGLAIRPLMAPSGALAHPAVPPEYRWRPGNPAAERMNPVHFVHAGPECGYLRSLARHPDFADLVSSGATPELAGCTFCRRPDFSPVRVPREDLLDWALVQLDAAQAAPRGPDGVLRVRLVGEQLYRALDVLAERVVARDLAPMELLVDARADVLVRRREVLDRALALLGPAEHRVEMCLIGIENFSDTELRRFNKGLAAHDNLEAVRVLRELAAAHPAVFDFRRYGGLSTILYTPWTTLGDIALNLAVVEHFDLRELAPKLLHARLRLYEDTVLTAAARRDGLLVDAYGDAALDTARRTFYADELPWRFQRPVVERFNRIATRLDEDASLRGDELYERVQRRLRRSGLSALRFAQRLCQELALAPDDPLREILERVSRHEKSPSYRALSTALTNEGPGHTRRQLATLQPTSQAAARLFATVPPGHLSDVLAFVAGIKPVCRLESVPVDQTLAVLSAVAAQVPGMVVRNRPRPEAAEPAHDLLLGRDERLVDELVSLSDAAARGNDDDPVGRIRRTGALLGYAPCCADSFAHSVARTGELGLEWLHVRNRIAAEGSVAATMRPVNGALSYVPCGLDCGAYAAQVERLRQFGLDPLPSPAVAWPVLILLGRPNQAAVLEPLSPVGPSFRYRCESLRGVDPRLQAVARGDRVELHAGRIDILRGEELLWRFVLDAYLWWHEGAFDPEFWAPVLRERLSPAPRPPALLAPAPRPAPPLDRVLGWLKRQLDEAGFRCASVLPDPDGALALKLSGEDGPVTVRWPRQGTPTALPLAPKTRAALLRVMRELLTHKVLSSLTFSTRSRQGAPPSPPLRGALGRRLSPGQPFWANYRLERLSETGAGARYEATIVLRRETERLRFRLTPSPAEAPLTRTALGDLVLLEDGRTDGLVSRPEHQADRALAFLLSRAFPRKTPDPCSGSRPCWNSSSRKPAWKPRREERTASV